MLSDEELAEIQRRTDAVGVAIRIPWVAYLETRSGIGGASFIGIDGDEIYVDINVGEEKLTSPNPRLDAVLDFIAHARDDIPRLLEEIRRLKNVPRHLVPWGCVERGNARLEAQAHP